MQRNTDSNWAPSLVWWHLKSVFSQWIIFSHGTSAPDLTFFKHRAQLDTSVLVTGGLAIKQEVNYKEGIQLFFLHNKRKRRVLKHTFSLRLLLFRFFFCKNIQINTTENATVKNCWHSQKYLYDSSHSQWMVFIGFIKKLSFLFFFHVH